MHTANDSPERLTHERLDVLFTKGPKSKGTCKNKLLFSKERKGKEKEQKAIFTAYCGVVNPLSGTTPLLGGGGERPD